MKRAVLVPDDSVPEPERLPDRWPGREVTLDGTVTFVRETPSISSGAEPALYVHGLGGSASNWTDLAGYLAHRFDGQAIDLPGFGRSEPARDYGIGALAARVARWIEYADRGPVHLFGNSLGGAVAVTLAGTRPELVRSLTLVSPAMPFLDPRRSESGLLVPLLFVPRSTRLLTRRLSASDPDELTRVTIEACFADPSRIAEQRMAEFIEEGALRHAVPWYYEAYVRSLRGLVRGFLRAYLPGQGSIWQVARRITVPTLVISGRQDRMVDIRVAPGVAKTVADGRLLMLEGVGHVAQMEVPRTVARAVLGMVEEMRTLNMAS
jgi:pimeloyl-ACP methyl ester carboxylesterase